MESEDKQKVRNTLGHGDHIIKVRDDLFPVLFYEQEAPDDRSRPYKLAPEVHCSWTKEDEDFGPTTLRSRIEPWLTALVQSEHLALLIGSGLTHAVHQLATGKQLPGMNKIEWELLSDEITAASNQAASAAGRNTGNFEDEIRAASELLRGLEILASRDDNKSNQADSLRSAIKNELARFAAAILEGERNVITAKSDGCERAFNYLVSFLMSFSSRSGTRERLQLFTTNYDRFLEAASDVAGLRLVDRFVGGLIPLFRASRIDVDLHYNPPGIRGEPRYLEGVARFTKLHGSIDWVDYARNIKRVGIPFGASKIDPYLEAPGLAGSDAMSLMVYPNSAKDRETALYPYVELFRDFAAAICRPNSTLICYGYSFGDEHINRVIEDMLTIPSTHVVVISYDDPLGRIIQIYDRLGRNAQISLLLGNHLGDLRALVDHYLPKPAIDRTTFRMADLLKARWISGKPRSKESEQLDGEQSDE